MMVNIWVVLCIQFGFIGLFIIGFIMRNYIIKNNKLNKIIESQDKYLNEMYETIKFTEIKIKEIDKNQTFQSDDEIGFFFTAIKGLQESLSEYIKLIK